jgi:2-polyprenyl-3-methyl-5-hydroxy-6-metoxy-1,4-benzoquinol methylase
VPYDPAAYWAELHKRDDLSAVGQSGLPVELNRWLYRALRRNVRSFLARHGLTRPFPDRAFDVGAGLGFWVRTWHDLGAVTVDGCDLVPAAIERLNERYGAGGEFVVADITRADQLPARQYPFVSCLNVLLHVTDPGPFDAALAAIAGLVEPGGTLILAEPIVAETTVLPPYDPERHSRARHLATYRDPLVAAGLELVEVAAATVLANNPIEAGSPAAYSRYVRWWKFVGGRTKRNPRSSRWIGPLVDTADRLAMRTGAAPSTKLLLFRRPDR